VRRSVGVALLASTAVALGACAPLTVSVPNAGPPTPQAPQTQTAERPTPAPPQTVAGGASGPVAAVRAFATRYINWTADSVSGDLRSLAEESVGQARSAMQLAASQTAQDYELHQGGLGNRGTVVAIASTAGHAHEYAVVTVERTTASTTSAYAGLQPAWHVALATVTPLAPGRWAVSGWQPEN
jgi:hypothetical protein